MPHVGSGGLERETRIALARITTFGPGRDQSEARERELQIDAGAARDPFAGPQQAAAFGEGENGTDRTVLAPDAARGELGADARRTARRALERRLDHLVDGAEAGRAPRCREDPGVEWRVASRRGDQQDASIGGLFGPRELGQPIRVDEPEAAGVARFLRNPFGVEVDHHVTERAEGFEDARCEALRADAYADPTAHDAGFEDGVVHGALFGATFPRVESKRVLEDRVAMRADELAPQRNFSRFAPSTTGRSHPGTLLAALLCWLDARSRGAPVLLRLEDLDRERSKPALVEAMQRDLEWLGLDWDDVERQSEQRERHEAVIERLVGEAAVYACDCSRARIRADGTLAPDGSHRYPGTCRARVVSRADWRSRPETLRLRLEAGAPVVLRDESGLDLSGDAALLFGDPLLRRRDGAYAYHFVSVVDDAARAVGRVVRGRDLAPSTMIQVAFQRRLGFPTPRYRHHCLYLERSGDKLSKLHGAVGIEALRRRYDAEALCGVVASGVGLVPAGSRCRPAELVAVFDWARVSTQDVVLAWDEREGLSVQAS